MAEISTEGAISVPADDIDLSLEDDLHVPETTGDDFDFDLGGKEDGHMGDNDDEESGIGIQNDTSTAALTSIEMAGDVDEIGYEDEGDEASAADGLNQEAAAAHVDGQSNEPHHNEGVEEIDYEVANHHGVTDNGDLHEQQDTAGPHDDIDFGFEVTENENKNSQHEDSVVGEEGGEIDHDDYNQDISMQPRDAHESGDVYDRDDEEGEEEDEEEEEEDDDDDDDDEDEEEGDEANDHQRRPEIDHDASDGTGQDYEDDEDDEADSPSNSLNSGLGRLQESHPASTFDVTVTWGDQVCPLFKAPDVDDPESFYLEDYEALNYPLSKFLRTVRNSISSWVNTTDEIFIRVDDLGFEFAETTTEALLNQVTFHHLCALHSTLLRNDNPAALKGIHITLGTRPNCLLRLKDLVSGAGSGKGLSTFQKTQSGIGNSSDESGDNDADSDESSPNGDAEDVEDAEEAEDAEDMPEEDEGGALISDAEGADVEMAGSLDDGTAASEGDLQATTHDFVGSVTYGAELETPAAEEDDGAAVGEVEEEVDFIDYTNEEGDDDGMLLGTTGVSDLTAQRAQNGDDHNLDHHDELDLLEDLSHAGDTVDQNQDDQRVAHLDPENGIEEADHEHQQGDNDEDDFLDLHGDVGGHETSTTAINPGSNKVTVDDLDVSLDSSATATLDHDEIDYEDTHTTTTGAGLGEVPQVVSKPLDAGADEIDWDDEIKNVAPSEATSTPATATGKRTREVDENGDALLEDLPEIKRHRAGDSPA